jgi:hypothetical protein
MRCINLIRSRIDLESISHQIPAKLEFDEKLILVDFV